MFEREPSARSPAEEEDFDGEEVEGREGDEEYDESEGENGEAKREDDGGDNGDGETFVEGSARSLGDASICPHITDEQEAFIRRVLEIPLDEHKCRDLITLDTLHIYYGGPEPMQTGGFGKSVSSGAQKGGEKGASSLGLKAVGKGAPKRKANGKDDRPSKKVTVTIGDQSPKKPSPLRPSHGVGKGLRTTSGLVIQGFARRLLTHKEHADEVMDPIIKDSKLDPCAE
ncbi:hypothetical protein SO802_029173 [Lithocarpus litseifolius]|uniref:Uncharacterized protein n=1 Tax=Lithocarpus litseifolius TaxID=425828 RepID=A0AAW2BVL1_9ROSI